MRQMGRRRGGRRAGNGHAGCHGRRRSRDQFAAVMSTTPQRYHSKSFETELELDVSKTPRSRGGDGLLEQPEQHRKYQNDPEIMTGVHEAREFDLPRAPRGRGGLKCHVEKVSSRRERAEVSIQTRGRILSFAAVTPRGGSRMRRSALREMSSFSRVEKSPFEYKLEPSLKIRRRQNKIIRGVARGTRREGTHHRPCPSRRRDSS